MTLIETSLTTFVMTLLCFSVKTNSLSSYSDSPNHLNAPSLSPSDEWIQYTNGSSVILQCTGEAPLTWMYPENILQKPEITQRMNVTSWVEGMDQGDYVYKSSLHISSLMYADTGSYVCKYQDAAFNTVSSERTSIHIFVKDGVHLLSPYEDYNPTFLFLLVRQNQEAIIPCHPTTPEVELSLMKGPEKVEIGSNLEYDPKQGFIINAPSHFYNGMFECVAHGFNLTETLNVYLTYRANTAVPQPELKGSHTHIMVGENMTFQCVVQVDRGVVVHMTWTYDSNELSDRIRITEPVKHSMSSQGFQYDEIEGSLSVRNVQLGDGGDYSCHVTNHDGNTNSISKTIDVHDQTFVNLTVPKESVSVGIDDDEAVLAVTIEAYPDPKQIIWMKDGHEISNNIRHYEIRIKRERTRLKIISPRREDAGVYTVKAFSRDENTSVSIQLIVLEPPSIQTVPADHLFLVNKSYTLNCTALATPAPSYNWFWKPCLFIGCQVNDNTWFPVNKSQQRNELLSVTAVESGFFQCQANNSEGHDNLVQEFFVSNSVTGFEMEVTQQMPVEGDDLEIKCTTHLLKYYSPVMSWQFENQYILMSNTSRLKMLHDRDSYSNIISAQFTSVTLGDSGLYICEADDRKGIRKRLEKQIFVQEMKPPTFTRPLAGSIILEIGMDYTLECVVEGLPKPEILWYHNKSLVIDGANTRLTHDNKRLQLVHMTEDSSGIYTCEASNRAGNVSSNITIHSKLFPGRTSSAMATYKVVLIVAVIVAVIVFAVLSLLFSRRYSRHKKFAEQLLFGGKGDFNPDVPAEDQIDCIPYNQRLEYPREQLNFGVLLL